MFENIIPSPGATAGSPLRIGPWEFLARAMHLAQVRCGNCGQGITFDEWAYIHADEVTALLTALAAIGAQRPSGPS
jgi:hypothetical protein